MTFKNHRYFKHKNHGGKYEVLGFAMLQTARHIDDMESLVIYQTSPGVLWARPNNEFFDGRFQEMGTAKLTSRKTELFALEKSHELLCKLILNGSCDLTSDEDDKLDFDAIFEVLDTFERRVKS